MNHVQLKFNNEFRGQLVGQSGQVGIGKGDNTFLPYELLLGALGSCLYATFLDVVKKMRLDYETCTLDIDWEKREEVPTTLKWAKIDVVIKGQTPDKEDKYRHAFQLATEYCSIFVTLSHVAQITYEVTFEAE